MGTPDTLEKQEEAVESAHTPAPEPFIPMEVQHETPAPGSASSDITILNDVEVTATVELGRTRLFVRDVLKLHRGSVIELDKLVGQPADLLINNTTVAKGEVIVLNERFGFRVSKFISPMES